MNPVFSSARFEEVPIVGILRGYELDRIPGIIGALVRAGLQNVEITMNSPGAATQIASAVRESGGELNVGAGTVTSLALLDEALNAGAQFIVTPTVSAAVIRECFRRKVPIFPGAFSPTEILQAWELGASMVKVFPAEKLGPAFIKSVKAPLPHVKLMPTGGVDLKTLPDYWNAGAEGFGIGTPLFDPARIAASDWDWLEQRGRAFVDTFRRAAGRLSAS